MEVSDLSIISITSGVKTSQACWTKPACKQNCLHKTSVGQLSKTTDNCHQAGFGAFRAIHTIHKFLCQKLSVNKSGWKNHQLLSKIACRHCWFLGNWVRRQITVTRQGLMELCVNKYFQGLRCILKTQTQNWPCLAWPGVITSKTPEEANILRKSWSRDFEFCMNSLWLLLSVKCS